MKKKVLVFDFLIALSFGAIITFSMALFQNYNRPKTLALNQKHLNKRRPSSISFSKKSEVSEAVIPASRLKLIAPTTLVLNNQLQSNASITPTTSEDEGIINEAQLSEVFEQNTQNSSQAPQSLEEKANIYYSKRLESFIVEKNGLPYSVCDLIIENKNNLYLALQKNNLLRETQGIEFVNQLNKDTEKLYHEELKRVLGNEFFPIFSQWNEKQEADLSEAMSGGTAIF